jgi:mannose-1-phosphate guanylyltransferase
MSSKIKVCIMAGGAGTRFWPMSTEEKPKQFIDILHRGRTMLQATYDRAADLTAPSEIYVLTHSKYTHLVNEQLPDIGTDQIIAEPERKNTAAAIAYASCVLARDSEDFVMVLLSADHVIGDSLSFLSTLETACTQAHTHQDRLFTLGIVPDRPHTGYGYLELGEARNSIIKVARFVEKPQTELAKVYVDSGNYLWNAGIFVWHFLAIKNAFNNHAQDIWSNFEKVDIQNETQVADAFSEVRAESIDYAVMERSDSIYTLRCQFGWNDLGTYSSLHELSKKDEEKNVVHASSLALENSSSNIILLDKGTTAIIRGLEGYIVCQSGDKLLIYPIDEEQNLKKSLSTL